MIENPSGQNPDETSRLLKVTLLGVTSAIPVLGVPLGLAIQELFERRSNEKQVEFLEGVITRLARLEQRNGHGGISELFLDEEFTDLFFESLKIAQKTTIRIKHIALANAIVNSRSATKTNDIRFIYLRYVEELTPSHLQLFDLLGDPKAYFEAHGLEWADLYMGGKSFLVEQAFPDWGQDFYNLLAKDLFSRGLISTDTLNSTMTGQGLAQSNFTKLGRDFYAFILATDTE